MIRIDFIIFFLGVIGLTVAAPNNQTICTGAASGTLLPDVSDCGRYWFCPGNGQPPLFRFCPGQLLFNPESGMCDQPRNVKCFQCPVQPAYINLPVSYSCQQFIRCINREAKQHICPRDLLFDTRIGECNLAARVNCTIAPILCRPGSGSNTAQFIQDPSNCARYYLCANGTLFNRTCPSPLVFNKLTTTCDFRFNSNCPMVPGGNDSTTFDVRYNDEESVDAIDFQCEFDGLYQHPYDNKKYIVCVSNEPEVYECPAGTQYDAAQHVCTNLDDNQIL